MTEDIKKRLLLYQELIFEGKPEPKTQLEHAADDAFNKLLQGQPAGMDEDEIYRILDAYRAKPNMTEKQWLDLEKEVDQFLAEQVDCSDPEYRPFAHEMGVLHRMCEAIRLTQEEETTGN